MAAKNYLIKPIMIIMMMIIIIIIIIIIKTIYNVNYKQF